MIFVTINDNSVHLTLTGQIKGKTRCVVYVDQTTSVYLPFSYKLVYMQHRRFLPKSHKYCAMKQQFDGEQEIELPPTRREENFVFKMVRNICVISRKERGEGIITKEKEKCLRAGYAI
jgi:hypothetical protein